MIGSFVFLFICLLLVMFTSASGHGGASSAATPTIDAPPSITPTSWWLNMLASEASPTLSNSSNLITPAIGAVTSACTLIDSPSPLSAGIYAYISLVPPLPNRIRSVAGKANTYLGQVQPGGGVRIVDGPQCADGLRWWLIETTQGGLRGWTAEGRGSAQWVVPCQDPKTTCHKQPAPTAISATPKPKPANQITTNNENNGNENTCTSDKFNVGDLAQVEQTSLLVVRSDPGTGDVLGRAGPLTVVYLIDGPVCKGGAIWWKVNVNGQNLSGWTVEGNLDVCGKENQCS